MVYITVKLVRVKKVQLGRRSASLVLKMLFMRFCKYFSSEGPSFALHKETGEGGHKNYIVQDKKEYGRLLCTSERLRLGGWG